MFFSTTKELTIEAETSYDALQKKQGRKVRSFLAKRLGIAAREIKFSSFFHPHKPEDPQNPKEIKDMVVQELLKDQNIPSPIRAAIKLADFFHEGGYRKFAKSKEIGTPRAPYLCHPLLVAGIIARVFHDDVRDGKMEQRRYFRLIIAGLLHDVKEEYKGQENVEEKIRKDLGPVMIEFFGKEIGIEETNAAIKIVSECSKDLYPPTVTSKEEKQAFKKAFVLERFGNEKNSSADAVIVKSADLLANAKEIDEEIELEIRDIFRKIEKRFRMHPPSSSEQVVLQEWIAKNIAPSQPNAEKALQRKDYEKHLYPILESRNIPETKPILAEAWELISKKVQDIKHQWEDPFGGKSFFRERFDSKAKSPPKKGGL